MAWLPGGEMWQLRQSGLAEEMKEENAGTCPRSGETSPPTQLGQVLKQHQCSEGAGDGRDKRNRLNVADTAIK